MHVSQAIAKIEKCIRRRRAAQKFMAAIDAAKAQFLDERALEAGAANSPWYTATALQIRMALASDVDILRQLHIIWRMILEVRALHTPP